MDNELTTIDHYNITDALSIAISYYLGLAENLKDWETRATAMNETYKAIVGQDDFKYSEYLKSS